MADYFGRYEMTRCLECLSVHPIKHDRGQHWAHRCDDTRSACGECGIIHDAYSSTSTGLSPCFSALRFELAEMDKLLNRIGGVNARLEIGRQFAQERLGEA